ncbi:MAG: MFS transporter [Weeksellaceae bacterium]
MNKTARHINIFGILSLFFIATAINIQVPLYADYAQAAGYGKGVTALAFAFFILGALPVTFFLGGISDRVGRKLTMIVGLLLMAVTTTLMIYIPRLETIFIVRILQGISFALTIPACTAYIAELSENGPTYSAKMVAIMTSLGFGSGSLFTGLALLSGRTLTPWSYYFVVVALLSCVLLSIGLKDNKGAHSSILRLPYYPTGSIKAGIAVAVAWAASGSILTLIPAQLTAINLREWVGPILFSLTFFGVITQSFVRKIEPRKAIIIGSILLMFGYSILIVGLRLENLALILMGTAFCSMACYGFSYLGSLAAVTKIAGDQKARATSGYFFFAYLGFALPSILVGFVADKVGLFPALQWFNYIIIAASIFIIYIVNKDTVAKRV